MFTKLTHLDLGTARMAERKLRALDIASRQHPVFPQKKRVEVRPFLCISRMVGSGGTEVAQLLGERLDWPVYDKEILQAMAGDNETRALLYSSLDERHVSWTEHTLRSLMEAGFCRNDYVHRLTETVLWLAQSRSAIFVGRAMDLVLPRDRGLRVRFGAPREHCLKNFAARHSLSLEKARLELQRVETERESFVRCEFHREPADPGRFDLGINLGTISIENAAELVLTALRLAPVAPSDG